MFRIVVLIIDFIVLGFVITMSAIESPHDNLEIVVLAIVHLIVILNIAYILFSKADKETWISLYFQRKRLEEKKKIDELSNK